MNMQINVVVGGVKPLGLALSELFQQSLCYVWVHQSRPRNCYEPVQTLKKCFLAGKSALGAVLELAAALINLGPKTPGKPGVLTFDCG